MKTNDHNKQLYRNMQEAPDKYSDQEIEAMMDDLDQVPDVDEAWQQFAQQHISSVRLMHTWRKVAAMIFGILTLSGIAFAAVHIVHQSQHEKLPVTAVEKPQSAVTISQTLPTDTIVKTEPVVFDNVTLIMSHSIALLRTLQPIITLIWTCRMSRPVCFVSISYGIKTIVCKRS